MMYTFKKDDASVPVKIWSEEGSIEAGAIVQLENTSKLPFVFKHIAVMPDCHQGYGVTIGSVVATEGVVIPNAVGVDIGCGMLAVMTDFESKNLTPELIKQIFGGSKEHHGGIRAKIPVGMNHRKDPVEWSGFAKAPNIKVVQDELASAAHQLGTLGGGNHFIELQRDGNGHVWFMIHSGSRNIGFKIANHYNAVATALCEQWHSNIPPIKGQDGLAFLPLCEDVATDYILAMNFALDFAYANRMKMAYDIKDCLKEVLGCTCSDPINIHHNYAKMEHHFGRNVMVHRKGATSARTGEVGIIPGSQGTKSYIVCGKGNPDSFNSCSHGAGRKMSRTKAQNELNLEDELKKMEDQGIVHGIRTKKDLDEAAGAYKDIDSVMKNQEDLVEIVTELQPMAVIKG